MGHPFVDGNKRMAILFTHAFLYWNGFDFKYTYKEMYSILIHIIEISQKYPNEEDLLKRVLKSILEEAIKPLT